MMNILNVPVFTRSNLACCHPFLVVKKQFGYAKVVYRGITKKHEPISCPVRQCKSGHECKGWTKQGFLYGISALILGIPIRKWTHIGSMHRRLMSIWRKKYLL